MTVVVNELSTEVRTTGGGETGAGAASPPAAAEVGRPQVERLRAAAARLAEDRARTRAEGFDD